MSTFNYTRTAATATKLLLKFGSLGRVSIRRVAGETYDPVEGSTTGGTPTTTTLTAATVPIKKSMIDGERILATDIMFLSNADFEPVSTDIAIIDALEYRIIDIEPITPDGTDVLYKVVCRG